MRAAHTHTWRWCVNGFVLHFIYHGKDAAAHVRVHITHTHTHYIVGDKSTASWERAWRSSVRVAHVIPSLPSYTRESPPNRREGIRSGKRREVFGRGRTRRQGEQNKWKNIIKKTTFSPWTRKMRGGRGRERERDRERERGYVCDWETGWKREWSVWFGRGAAVVHSLRACTTRRGVCRQRLLSVTCAR